MITLQEATLQPLATVLDSATTIPLSPIIQTPAQQNALEQSVLNAAQQALTLVQTAYHDVTNNAVVNELTNEFGHLRDNFNNVVSSVVPALQHEVASVQSGLHDIGAFVGNSFNSLTSALTGGLKNVQDFVSTGITNVVNDVSTGFLNVVNTVRQKIGAVVQPIVQEVQQAAGTVLSAVKQGATDVAAFAGSVLSFIESIPKDLSVAFSDALSPVLLSQISNAVVKSYPAIDLALFVKVFEAGLIK